ncbi:sn-glycerol-3-phosphate ABC transporter ATP-binding protein UgpC [Vibrio sp. SCSIO 43132]|uniref:ABC transporter ATP-binding protein n=1 Tax=Vibrio sp. SCSIO 43132 TaxID=2779363 RepID=UPI001CA857EA|nr:sn-glycerol-3-phosphate ABC transporter ATP-binding protein UgpC [Vibrio sp. SCSIO 43132]UAB69198.1 sn-glycerol-3-phosphate ABC transporter ATP-binding protein UgpC [Vibrio sp. SCSIO 43132]
MTSVNIKNLVKEYGTSCAIHGIDVNISEGEFAVLVGPSGCGKSTLLRMIAGLEDITSGTISIGNSVVNDKDPKDRNIAMVFQNYALYPHKRVRDNMAYALKLKKVDKAIIQEKVSKAAEILDLTHLLDRYPRQLSGGQRQRVAMGRAIVRDPDVFLFDEPLSNLDAKLRVQMRTEIKALHMRLKNTMIYVTHDQIEAMTMADKIVVMKSGRIEQVGTPVELYEQPANEFVACFIGSPSMNILPARVEGSCLMLEDDQSLPIPEGYLVEDGQKVKVGIRPEHLIFSDSSLKGDLSLIEPTGAETLFHLRIANQEIIASIRGKIDDSYPGKVGISPLPNSVHLFDADSGQAITSK